MKDEKTSERAQKIGDVRVVTDYIERKTKGAGDLVDLTDELKAFPERHGLSEGSLTVFVTGSTAGITTFEFESGLIKDMRELYEKIAPSDRRYHHNDTWHDDNGFSHVRAAIQGPALVVPFTHSKLLLGTWQQVVLAEFDNRPRERKIVVQLIGR